MKHLLSLVSCLFIAYLSCTAQSAITIGLDGGHALLVGTQVKYTHTFKKIQLGAFVIPAMSNHYNWEYITRLGFCINSVPVKKKTPRSIMVLRLKGIPNMGSHQIILTRL